MLRWDGHFKYKFGIIHIKIARLRRASIIVSIFAAKWRFFPSFCTWSQPPRNLVPDALRAYPVHKPTDWIRPCSYGFLVSSQYSIFVVIILLLPNFKVKARREVFQKYPPPPEVFGGGGGGVPAKSCPSQTERLDTTLCARSAHQDVAAPLITSTR